MVMPYCYHSDLQNYNVMSNKFIHCKLAKPFFKSSGVPSGAVNKARGATLILKQSNINIIIIIYSILSVYVSYSADIFNYIKDE